MNYVRKLGFEEAPDYDFLRELFTKVLKTLGEPDDGIFDWMLLNGGKGWEASQRVKVGLFLLSSARQSADRLFRVLQTHTPLTGSIDTVTLTTVVGHDLSTGTHRLARLWSWDPPRFRSSPAEGLLRSQLELQIGTPAYNH